MKMTVSFECDYNEDAEEITFEEVREKLWDFFNEQKVSLE
jgi:hypothetical protein